MSTCGDHFQWQAEQFGVMALCELPPGHEQDLHAGRVAAYSPGYTINPSGIVVRWPVAA